MPGWKMPPCSNPAIAAKPGRSCPVCGLPGASSGNRGRVALAAFDERIVQSIFDSLQHFSNDVPILGGNWSLKLVPEFSPEEGWADYYIIGPEDRYVYRLAVWAKTVGDWDGGSVQFLLRSPGTSELRQYTPVNVESWQYYSLEDTVRLYDDDTLVVRLSAGTGNPDGNDAVLFDEVSLQRYK